MKFLKWIVAGALVCGLAAAGAAQRRGDVVAEKGGEDETGPYDVVPNWPQPLHTDRTYVAEVWGGRFQKFIPKTGAPSARLIGPLFSMPVR